MRRRSSNSGSCRARPHRQLSEGLQKDEGLLKDAATGLPRCACAVQSAARAVALRARGARGQRGGGRIAQSGTLSAALHREGRSRPKEGQGLGGPGAAQKSKHTNTKHTTTRPWLAYPLRCRGY